MIKEKHFYPTGKQLSQVPTKGDHNGLSKKSLKSDFEEIAQQLGDLQELIFAESKHKILIILQGLDTSGKDGTIKHVFGVTNPQGVRVISYKRPSDLELRHDYLWRIHKETPQQGEFTIFNRSHYEDVIMPTVHKTLPASHIAGRIADINAFEKMLVHEGVTLFKFFLHISKKEQAQRLRERIANPQKHWKFELSDLEERRLWPKYQKAYSQIIEATHHKDRPWNIIPADDKVLRNYIISSILVERIKKLKPGLPAFDKKTVARIKQELKYLD